MKLAWRKKEAWEGLCRVFSSSPDLVSGLSADRKRVGRKNKESVWRTRAWLHLAGVSAQLLPARRLFLLWLRAGVGAPVEGRHRAAFAVCVKAAVRRVVCLAVPFGLLECTHLLLQHRILLLQVVDVLLVSVVFPPHELDVLGGFVQNLGSGSLLPLQSRHGIS